MRRRKPKIDPECQGGLALEIDMLAQAVVAAEQVPPRRWLARWGALPTENMPKEFHPLVNDYKFVRNQIASQFKRRRPTSEHTGDDVRYSLTA